MRRAVTACSAPAPRLRTWRPSKAQRRLAKNPPPGTRPAEQVPAGHYREVTLADARSRFATAAVTRRPFAERLHLFWANHFTVSLAKGSARGLVGAFERDAIRPNIAGSFEALLVASTTHPAMLRYLDNNQSAGPNSRIVARAARRAARNDETARITGLNENLAREVLELHTLGAATGGAAYGGWGGYTQADVTAFARVLTGWRVGLQDTDPTKLFDADWHEPGRKTVLGKTYAEGPGGLAPGAARSGAPPIDRTFHRHQAGTPLRCRHTTARAGGTARGGVPAQRRAARRGLPHADPQPRGLGAAGRRS